MAPTGVFCFCWLVCAGTADGVVMTVCVTMTPLTVTRCTLVTGTVSVGTGAAVSLGAAVVVLKVDWLCDCMLVKARRAMDINRMALEGKG